MASREASLGQRPLEAVGFGVQMKSFEQAAGFGVQMKRFEQN